MMIRKSGCKWTSFFCVLFITFLACSIDKRKNENKNIEEDKIILSGEQLSKSHCGRCHIYPSPELLDKKSWREGVLPQMGYRFGIYDGLERDTLIEKGIAGKIVNKAGIFPAQQVITNEKWEKIKQFYLENAPDSLSVPIEREIKNSTSVFSVVEPKIPKKRPFTTVIKYDPHSKCYYLANSTIESSSISIFNAHTQPLTELGLPFPIADITIRSDTLLVLMMGHFVPSDEPAGMLIKAFKGPVHSGYEGGGFSVVINRLQRPVDVAYSDLDQDGHEDIVVCEYGNHTGKLSLFLKRSHKEYDKKILNRNPGAIQVAVEDVNNDSLKDIIALMAQGDEGIDIYYNQGGGQFKKESILRFPPSYGSTSFSLIDFDKDGHLDILYTNGDNADYSPILKPYHGVRIFLNDGKNHFEESYFYWQNGAYKAIAHDFDHDGDIDIASISFFPDFFKQPEEGFIYLENKSSGRDFHFVPSTFSGADAGRWITMNISDVDADGDEDLLLGSYTGMGILRDTAKSVINKMITTSPAFLILENTTNNPGKEED